MKIKKKRKLFFLWSVFSIFAVLCIMIGVADIITDPVWSVWYSILCSVVGVGMGFTFDSVLKDYNGEI